jgi:hypothetical protein
MSSLTRASSSRPEQAREEDSHFHVIPRGQAKMVEFNTFEQSFVESRCRCGRSNRSVLP